MNILQFFRACFSKCRLRPANSEGVNQRLLAADDKKREPAQETKAPQETRVTIPRRKETLAEQYRDELTTSISYLQAHKRLVEFNRRMAGPIALGLGAGLAILKLQSIYAWRDTQQSFIDGLQNQYATTWVNYTYVPGSIDWRTPTPWPITRDYSTCLNAYFPMNNTAINPHWMYKSIKMGIVERLDCYSSLLDFRSTTGMLMCAQLINELCAMFKIFDPNQNTGSSYLALSIGFGVFMIASFLFPLPAACVCWVRHSSSEREALHIIAEKNLIINDRENDFTHHLRWQPDKLLIDYQNRLRDNDFKNAHNKELAAYTFDWNLNRSLKLQKIEFGKPIVKYIKTLANLDTITITHTPARKTLIKAINRNHPLFFPELRKTNSANSNNKEDKTNGANTGNAPLVLNKIFRFAGV